MSVDTFRLVVLALMLIRLIISGKVGGFHAPTYAIDIISEPVRIYNVEYMALVCNDGIAAVCVVPALGPLLAHWWHLEFLAAHGAVGLFSSAFVRVPETLQAPCVAAWLVSDSWRPRIDLVRLADSAVLTSRAWPSRGFTIGRQWPIWAFARVEPGSVGHIIG